MKLIRSNKKGFGIHSPFVYCLITRVLFSKADFYIFEEIDKLHFNLKDKETLKLLFRLLNYFHPEEVLFCGNFKKNEMEVVSKSNLNLVIHKIESNSDVQIKENELIASVPFVVYSEDYFQTKIKFPKKKSVWFIKKTNNNEEFNRFFQTLLNSEAVNITIELKNALIVIFDEKFHKQNYVIK